MAGIAIGHAAWSRKPGVPEMGLEGSSPSPVASRAQPRRLFLLSFSLYPGGHSARAIQRRRLSVGRPALTQERLVRFQSPLPAALCGAVSSLFCISLAGGEVREFPSGLLAPPRQIKWHSPIGRAPGFDPEGDGSSPSAAATATWISMLQLVIPEVLLGCGLK